MFAREIPKEEVFQRKGKPSSSSSFTTTMMQRSSGVYKPPMPGWKVSSKHGVGGHENLWERSLLVWMKNEWVWMKNSRDLNPAECAGETDSKKEKLSKRWVIIWLKLAGISLRGGGSLRLEQNGSVRKEHSHSTVVSQSEMLWVLQKKQ